MIKIGGTRVITPGIKIDDINRSIEKYKDDMFDLIDKTRRNKHREYGFAVMHNPKTNRIWRTSECVGVQHCVVIPETKDNEFRIYDFHTHPYVGKDYEEGDSPFDVAEAFLNYTILTCIGTQGHGRDNDHVDCYDLKYDSRYFKKYLEAYEKNDRKTMDSLKEQMRNHYCYISRRDKKLIVF